MYARQLGTEAQGTLGQTVKAARLLAAQPSREDVLPSMSALLVMRSGTSDPACSA
jgi:hypothetical protein